MPFRERLRNNPPTTPGPPTASPWRLVAESMRRPYRVTWPMVLLLSLVPLYIFIGDYVRTESFRVPAHVPEVAMDRVIPLVPAWALVYGMLYLFLIVLPVLVVRQQEHVDQTVRAYLLIWITAYVCFLAYPTAASRPAEVLGESFMIWSLRFLYSSDPAFNCLPSLHVAHSFVSALTCLRVHRGVGVAAILGAVLVAISTLFTKQHYVLDVVTGVLLACVACAIFLWRGRAVVIPEFDRRVAPYLAITILIVVSCGVACFWVAYQMGAT
jgi:membrane-associated phospholipid phosphatase